MCIGPGARPGVEQLKMLWSKLVLVFISYPYAGDRRGQAKWCWYNPHCSTKAAKHEPWLQPFFFPELFLSLRLVRLKGAPRARRTEVLAVVATINKCSPLPDLTIPSSCCFETKPSNNQQQPTSHSLQPLSTKHQQNACPSLPRCPGRHCRCHSRSPG